MGSDLGEVLVPEVAQAEESVVRTLSPVVAFYRSRRVVSTILDHDLKQIGLTDREAYLLALLAEADRSSMSMTDICEAMRLPRSLGTTTVHHLEKLGLVVRSTHPTDKRKALVVLTAKGKRVEQHSTQVIQESMRRRLLRYLSEDELDVLERMNAVFDAVYQDFERQQRSKRTRTRPPAQPSTLA